MSSNSDPIFIELCVSRQLGAGLAGVYAGAFAVVMSSPLSAPFLEGATLILVICALRDVTRHLRPDSPHRIRRILLKDTFECVIVNGAGEVIRGRPLNARLVHPWIVAFTLDIKGGGKKSVLVLPDMTSRRNFHALRVRLMHTLRGAHQ